MIELKNVSLSYNKEYYALYNINLSIQKGECVAVVGLSGSGKSSLLRLIAGLDKPVQGEILIDKVPIEEVDFISQVSVGFLSSKPVFFENKSVYNNLAWALKIRKIDKQSWETKIDDALNEFNILELKNKKVNKLTKTEKKLVQIARLMLRPLDILLCDDIGINPEEENFEVLSDAFKKLVKKDKKHKAVVFVCNNFNLFQDIATRKIKLVSGSVEEDIGVSGEWNLSRKTNRRNYF